MFPLLLTFLAMTSLPPAAEETRTGGWRLESATSPYLRQHSGNPVEWYPWGEEAFERARRENRPIFLSIGYSTCHWCHVMERESFSSPAVAGILNEHFVSIKVDREERPDLDSAYLGWLASTNGDTGWPANLLLTPDLVPFWGGTYFPPEPAGGKPGLKAVLTLFAQQWEKDPARIQASAEQMRGLVNQLASAGSNGELEVLEQLVRERTGSMFNPVEGGFGPAPRFPQPSRLLMLLRHAAEGDREAAGMVELTLDRIAASALHDRLRGGFHRYSVDSEWRVPHYEKMLYDQAQLARVFTEASVVLPRHDFTEIARSTLDFIHEEMRLPGGGWASALAAEAPGPDGEPLEGAPYLWTSDQVRQALAADDARIFILRFGLADAPRPLHVSRSVSEIASSVGASHAVVERSLERSLTTLARVAAERERPFRDGKVIVAWNAMAISAHARLAAVTGDAELISRAGEAATFLLKNNRDGKGRLTRVWSDGEAGTSAFADDFGQLIIALLDLYEASGDVRWLRAAIDAGRELQSALPGEDGAIRRSADLVPLDTAAGAEEGDSAEPHWSGVLVEALTRLSSATLDEKTGQRSAAVAREWTRRISSSPQMWPNAIEAFSVAAAKPRQIVVTTSAGSTELDGILRVIHSRWRRGEVLLMAENDSDLIRLLPHLESMRTAPGSTTVYVCENYTCRQPVTTAAELTKQLTARDGRSIELSLPGDTP